MSTVSVRKRGKRWEYRFDLPALDGRRRQYSKSGFRTRKEAQAEGMKALALSSSPGSSPGMTLSAFLGIWLSSKERSVSRNTYISYRGVARSLDGALGGVRLTAVTPARLQAWLDGQGLAHRSMAHRLTVLRLIMRDAVESFGYIGKSPAEAVRLPRAEPDFSKEAVDPVIGPARFRELLAGVPRCYRMPLLLGWHCGLRASEALGLTWDRVDLGRKALTVDRQLSVRVDGMDRPKTRGSVREISFSEGLRLELEAEKARQEEDARRYGKAYVRAWLDADGHGLGHSDGASGGKGLPVDFVCRREDGAVVSYVSYEHWLHRHGLRSHQLRHTHATMLIEAGADILAVSKRLGHANVRVTMGIYAHATAKMDDRVTSLLGCLDV